jgi:serpin B
MTAHDNFYLPVNEGQARVPFLSSAGKQHIVSRPGYKVLMLPYADGGQNGAFSMYCTSISRTSSTACRACWPG